jgi:micrococcal nuclease
VPQSLFARLAAHASLVLTLSACTAPELPAQRRCEGLPDEQCVPGGAALCTVARVVDGDTLVCDDGLRIRLLLIDAPELSQGGFGALAKSRLEELAGPGTPLLLEHDVQRLDRYGRTLAYLYLPDGRMVNEELLRAGVALVSVHPPNVRHVERLRVTVDSARSAKLGLWSTPAFECAPAEHRVGKC